MECARLRRLLLTDWYIKRRAKIIQNKIPSCFHWNIYFHCINGNLFNLVLVACFKTVPLLIPSLAVYTPSPRRDGSSHVNNAPLFYGNGDILNCDVLLKWFQYMVIKLQDRKPGYKSQNEWEAQFFCSFYFRKTIFKLTVLFMILKKY